jgi:hypothetical protein
MCTFLAAEHLSVFKFAKNVSIPAPKLWAFYRVAQTQNVDFLGKSSNYFDYISLIFLGESPHKTAQEIPSVK